MIFPEVHRVGQISRIHETRLQVEKKVVIRF